MKVYDDSNFEELTGDGHKVHAAGDVRLLSAMPKPAGHDTRLYSKPFKDGFSRIPRSEWPARIAEQKAKRMRVSDFQKFKAHDQNGLPTCWANGPAHAATTLRVMQGLPLVYISACSLAVPISGGHSGGYEGEALQYMAKNGAASTDVWSNNDTSRSLNSDPKVAESRKHHFALESYECESFDDYATALLLGLPIAIAFNWWSHVISGGDLVQIEGGSFGINYRNNWSDSWGEKNDYGFGGYVTMREGKGTPDSGFALRQVTSSPT